MSRFWYASRSFSNAAFSVSSADSLACRSITSDAACSGSNLLVSANFNADSCHLRMSPILSGIAFSSVRHITSVYAFNWLPSASCTVVRSFSAIWRSDVSYCWRHGMNTLWLKCCEAALMSACFSSAVRISTARWAAAFPF